MRPSSEVGSQFFVNKLKITWSRVSPRYPGADPGFWFGRGTGTRSGRRKSPRGVQGQSPGGGLGDKSPEVRRMLRQEAKYTYGEKKTSQHRLTVHSNVIIIIISSTHRFMFPDIFVLKYKNTKRSEMVHNSK